MIGFVLTLVYICYSGYIFTNELASDDYDDGLYSAGPFYITERDPLMKVNGDGAFAKKDGDEYKCIYYKKDKITSLLAKFSDLGKKQYNYEKKRHFPEGNEEFNYCYFGINYAFQQCKESGKINYTPPSRGCTYVYLNDQKATGFGNKYLFDRWVTTIIFSCFIIACCIGLAIFGFLLFKSDGSGI